MSSGVDPTLVTLVVTVITALGGAVSTLAVTIYKMLKERIATLEQTVKEQNEREQKRIELQATTVQTLQRVVDLGVDRLAQQQPRQGDRP